MKRLVVLTGMVLALGLAVPGTASASASSLTLDPKADLSAGKTSAVATGTIVCTAGDEVLVEVEVLQSSGKLDAAGVGSATIFVCSGQVQTWAATVDVVVGAAFKHGPATALFLAVDTTDGAQTPTQTQGIKLG